MTTLTISITDFSDEITLEHWGNVDYFVSSIKDCVERGGKVIFERRYENAKPEILMIIANKHDLKEWQQHLKDVIKIIKNAKNIHS